MHPTSFFFPRTFFLADVRGDTSFCRVWTTHWKLLWGRGGTGFLRGSIACEKFHCNLEWCMLEFHWHARLRSFFWDGVFWSVDVIGPALSSYIRIWRWICSMYYGMICHDLQWIVRQHLMKWPTINYQHPSLCECSIGFENMMIVARFRCLSWNHYMMGKHSRIP